MQKGTELKRDGVVLPVQRIVLDANIVISALLKDSTTRKMLVSAGMPEMFAPDFIFEEIRKYLPELARRIGADKKELEILMNQLFSLSGISVAKTGDYSEFMEKALEITPDQKDAPYVALAMKLECPIWSQDSGLKKQKKVEVYSTAELYEFSGSGFMADVKERLK